MIDCLFTEHACVTGCDGEQGQGPIDKELRGVGVA